MNNGTTTRTVLSAVMVLLALAIAAGTASAAAGDVTFNGGDGTAKANATSNSPTFDNISIDLEVWNLNNATEITWSGSTSGSLYLANFTDDTSTPLGTGADSQPLTIKGNDSNGMRTLNITSGVVIPSLTITFTDAGNPLNNTTTTVLSPLNFTASNLYFIPDTYPTKVGTNKTLYIQATGVQGGNSDPNYGGIAVVTIGAGSASAGAYLYNTTHKEKSVQISLSSGAGSVTFNGTAIGSVAVIATNSTGYLASVTDATVTVIAGDIDHFDVLPDPTSTRTGEPLTKITVKAKDAYNNLITDFEGTVTFTSNSSAPTTIWAGNPAIGEIRLPGPHTFTSFDGGQYDFLGFNDTVNETVKVIATLSGGTANGSGTVTVDPNVAYYVGIELSPSGSKTAGVEFNATATVYDVFHNINYTSGSSVNVKCSAPDAFASVDGTTDQPVGSNNTAVTVNGPKLVYVNITKSTVENLAYASFNLTANRTGLSPYPLSTSSDNNATVEDIEVVPNDANKLVKLVDPADFQANGRALGANNITVYVRDVYGNNCTKTTNATGTQITVDFELVGANATSASLSDVITISPSLNNPLPVSAANSTGIAIATAYLWSGTALSENLLLTINITNTHGLSNATQATCTVTPWKVDHINITFSKDPIVADGTDAATITAYLEDDLNVTVTTATFNVTFDLNTVGVKATGQLSVSNTMEVQAASGVVTGVSVNATKTNAAAGTDDPTQKLNVTANITDATYTPAYSTGGNSSLLNVTPGPAAWLDVVSSLTTQTVDDSVTIKSTVRDANMNIVLDHTAVGFRTTSGLIGMSERTVKGEVTPGYESPRIASTATITATTDSVSNTTDVVFTPGVAQDKPAVPHATNLLYLSGDTPADGTSTVTVTVYLKDAYNNTNTATNTTVYLSTTRGTFAGATGELVNGVYQTTLTSPTPGSATVTANIGNWRQDTETMTFTEVAFDNNITLNNGWNLISVPKTLNAPTDAWTLFNLTVDDSVQYYNGLGWATALDQAIEPCKGYWVKNSGSTKTATLNYKTITGAAVPPTVDLPAGWCMIGHTSTTPTAVSTVLSSIDGSYSMVLTSPSAGVWETYIPSSEIQDFTKMYPGQGYWIFMKSSGTYAAIST